VTERKRSYQLGNRGKDRSKLQGGKLGPNRWAWVGVYFGKFIIWGDYKKDDDGNDTDEVADVKLMYPIPNRPPVSWNLTACTEDELIALKHLFDTAFETALPIARQRDKEARDAFDQGDDSHSRIYRQLPQLVYRAGPFAQHGEGVHDGPEDAAPAHDAGVDPDGGVREAVPGLAERDPSVVESQDDGTPPH